MDSHPQARNDIFFLSLQGIVPLLLLDCGLQHISPPLEEISTIKVTNVYGVGLSTGSLCRSDSSQTPLRFPRNPAELTGYPEHIGLEGKPFAWLLAIMESWKDTYGGEIVRPCRDLGIHVSPENRTKIQNSEQRTQVGPGGKKRRELG